MATFTSTVAAADATSTKTVTLTDAQLAARVRWFIDGWAPEMPAGLTAKQQRQWMLDQLHQRWWDWLVAESNRAFDRNYEQQSKAAQDAAREEEMGQP